MSPHIIINNIRKKGTTEQDEKNLQIMNFQNKCQKNNNYIEKKKDIVSGIQNDDYSNEILKMMNQ